MEFTKQDVARSVKRLGHRGAHFQFPTLREDLKVEATDRNRSSRLHNYFKQMLADGTVEEVSGGTRRRNRYYRVKSEEKLRELTPAPANAPNGTGRPGGPADRLARIEGGIQALGERLEHIEARLNDLAAAWA